MLGNAISDAGLLLGANLDEAENVDEEDSEEDEHMNDSFHAQHHEDLPTS